MLACRLPLRARWQAVPCPALRPASLGGRGVGLGDHAQPLPGGLCLEVEVPGVLHGEAAGAGERAADQPPVQADAAVVTWRQGDRAGMNTIAVPGRWHLGRAEQDQVAVHAGVEFGVVIAQQPGRGVSRHSAIVGRRSDAARSTVKFKLTDGVQAHPVIAASRHVSLRKLCESG